MPGAQRARSLACKIKKHTSIVTTGSDGFNRHSPRNGFTAYFALSPAIGLVVTVICASSRRLDAGVEASEPHDFAVRVSTVRQTAPPASTASRPASVTIASRPSDGTGPNRYSADFTPPSSEILKIRNCWGAVDAGWPPAA